MPKRLSQEEFIRRAKEKYGDKYDYSLVKYVNCRTNVQIICPKHGVSSQKPLTHLKKVGCKQCSWDSNADLNRLDTEEIISRFKDKHGDAYDYSHVKDVGNIKQVVTLKCKVHGTFNIRVDAHFKGSGCQKCGMKVGAFKRSKRHKPKYTPEFVKEKGSKVHKGKYDYKDVQCSKATDKIDILCPVHGKFKQNVGEHLRGRGCSKCSSQKRVNNLLNSQPKSFEQFLEDSFRHHGDKYDYSEVVYTNRSAEVDIICPSHGRFSQNAGAHANGSGCRTCGYFIRPERDFTDWIKESQEEHDNKYTYAKVGKPKNSKVCITCPKHGDFWQRPDKHVQGAGCPKCTPKMSRGERRIEKFLTSGNLLYETQKTFEDCKHKHKLRFDFFLPEQNILIEYQGIQHYFPVEVFGCQEGFDSLQVRDQIKKLWCEKKGIRLEEIRYDETVETRMKEILGDKHGGL